MVGLAAGVILAANPFQADRVSPQVGIVAWCLGMLLVLGLSGHPVGRDSAR